MTDTQIDQPREDRSDSEAVRADRRSGLFTDILCAIDGTESSLEAVRVAAELAGAEGHLTLLAVTAQSGDAAMTAKAAISPGRVERVLDVAKEIADEAGVQASKLIDPGEPPVRVILERAAEHELLAIGPPATSWLGGILVGGVVSEALTRFETPMLIAHRHSPRALRGGRVVVASDCMEGSDEAVELAATLGWKLDSAVTLVHAIGVESQERPHRIESQAQALKDRLGESAELRIEAGKATDVIIQAAKDTGAAVVLMGSRGLGGLRAFGSVSRRVVYDAPCSVLLLPSH